MSDGATWVVRFETGSVPGVRLAVKDCIDVEGTPTGVGCEAIAALAGPAAADADVVAAARKAGAVIVGKTNLTELCWTASGINAWAGTPSNPVGPGRVPGGSSSGSAVAVAAGEADVALGTDTGGSIRIPAACCGVAGLKTTWGRVSLRGVYPLAPSLDTVGPLGADMAAVELGMRLIDPSFSPSPSPSPSASASPSLPSVSLAPSSPLEHAPDAIVGRIRPGVDVDPAVDAAVDRALAAASLAVTGIAGPDLAVIDRLAGVIIDGEAYRANEYLLPHLDRLSQHSRDGMAAGASITDADLAAARSDLGSIRAWFAERFEDYPFLAMPTLVGAPPLVGGPRIPLTVLTMPVNLAGLPALALPVPGGPAGLPASLQLIGPPHSEERLIALGRQVEAALR